MTFSTDAIVLKITKTGESDRLLTLLTRDRGILKAFAKAADRPKNKLHMSTNLFCYGRFTFYEGVKSTKVEECDLNETFFGLQQDITKLALAQYFNELMIESAPVETDANEYLRLLLNSLYFLANDKKNIHILKSLFELRLASLIGYMPSLIACSECGEFETDPMYFNEMTGELFCCNCKGAGTKCYPLEVITAMRHIVFSEFDKLFSLGVSESSIYLLEAATEKYLTAVLRKKFRTLDFYKSITQ
ncbi:MAG: DNA repair protein RecO [Clostridia bacterium]|nr:DNA repair protein RecO [Clostridia bacterium]